MVMMYHPANSHPMTMMPSQNAMPMMPMMDAMPMMHHPTMMHSTMPIASMISRSITNSVDTTSHNFFINQEINAIKPLKK